jgi:hypothetical protein
MFSVDSKLTNIPKVDVGAIENEARQLAEEMAELYARNARGVLRSRGKGVRSGAVEGVKPVMNASSSRGGFRAAVAAPPSLRLKEIQDGRRPGAKAPLVRVGTGPRGGGVFEAVVGLREWLRARGIPRRADYPIAMSIARKGIKPVDVQGKAMEATRRGWTTLWQRRLEALRRKLFSG